MSTVAHPPSGAAPVPQVADALAAAGGRRLPEVFMFPVEESGRRRMCSTSLVRQVRWREETRPFYLRSAVPPFDIVPLRPGDARRAGVWFSLGPAFIGDPGGTGGTGGSPGELHDQVLLVQVEGESADVMARGEVVRALARQWAGRVRESVDAPRTGWLRMCLSAVLAGEPAGRPSGGRA